MAKRDFIKIEDYKGFEISYDNFGQRFILEQNGTQVREAPTQKGLEAKADLLLRNTKKLDPPVPVLTRDWNEFSFGKATSYDIEHKEVWVTTKEGRGKHSLDHLFADNEPNREAIKRIGDIDTEIRRLDLEIKALRNGLEPIDPATLISQKEKPNG